MWGLSRKSLEKGKTFPLLFGLTHPKVYATCRVATAPAPWSSLEKFPKLAISLNTGPMEKVCFLWAVSITKEETMACKRKQYMGWRWVFNLSRLHKSHLTFFNRIAIISIEQAVLECGSYRWWSLFETQANIFRPFKVCYIILLTTLMHFHLQTYVLHNRVNSYIFQSSNFKLHYENLCVQFSRLGKFLKKLVLLTSTRAAQLVYLPDSFH